MKTAISTSSYRARVRLVGLALSTILLMTACAWAEETTLLDVRMGPHKLFDRLVFEFERETVAQVVTLPNQQVEVRFHNVRLPENFTVPSLPRGLIVLKSVEFTPEGDNKVTFTISLMRDAMPTELPLAGTPWRLAVDFAPRVTESPEPKPDYIPGDQPIPTKFAEQEPATTDSFEPTSTHAVLAYFYATRGDTAAAAREAQAYLQQTGNALQQAPAPQQATNVSATKTPQKLLAALNWLRTLPTTAALLTVFMSGMFSGMALWWMVKSFRLPKWHLPKLRWPRFKRIAHLKDRSEELQDDMKVLDEAVEQEPVRRKKESSAEPEEPEIPVEVEAGSEQEIRETLMDRRVKRVLELSASGRTVVEIADEMQMGQDEIKLILDLNK
jgi:hypothetical protein